MNSKPFKAHTASEAPCRTNKLSDCSARPFRAQAPIISVWIPQPKQTCMSTFSCTHVYHYEDIFHNTRFMQLYTYGISQKGCPHRPARGASHSTSNSSQGGNLKDAAGDQAKQTKASKASLSLILGCSSAERLGARSPWCTKLKWPASGK